MTDGARQTREIGVEICDFFKNVEHQSFCPVARTSNLLPRSAAHDEMKKRVAGGGGVVSALRDIAPGIKERTWMAQFHGAVQHVMLERIATGSGDVWISQKVPVGIESPEATIAASVNICSRVPPPTMK